MRFRAWHAALLLIPIIALPALFARHRRSVSLLREEFRKAESSGGWALFGGGYHTPILRWSTTQDHPVPVVGVRGPGSGIGGVRLALSSSMDLVALGIDNGPLRIIERSSSRVLHTLQPPNYPTATDFTCPIFESEESLLFVETEWFGARYGLGHLRRAQFTDATITLSDVELGDDICTILCPCPELSRDGRYLAWISHEQDATFKQKRVNLAVRGTMSWETAWSRRGGSFALDPNGDWVATSSKNSVRIHDAAAGNVRRVFLSKLAREKPVAASPDGEWLLTESFGLFPGDLWIRRMDDGRAFRVALPEPKFPGSGTGSQSWVWMQGSP